MTGDLIGVILSQYGGAALIAFLSLAASVYAIKLIFAVRRECEQVKGDLQHHEDMDATHHQDVLAKVGEAITKIDGIDKSMKRENEYSREQRARVWKTLSTQGQRLARIEGGLNGSHGENLK